MSDIVISSNYSAKRSFGWCQDASDFSGLKKVVKLFVPESDFYAELVKIRIPKLVDDNVLRDRFLLDLGEKPVKLSYSALVGSHTTPRKNSPCNGIIQAAIDGQTKPYLSDWAADSFLRWCHLCGFIEYDGSNDCFSVTTDGYEFAMTKDESLEEKECLLNALLMYPPVSRVLSLLSGGEHLSKFEIGMNLGFVGDEGFTSLPQNILLNSLALSKDSREKNKMKSDWDGTSDKYARQICKWLEKLDLVKQIEKEYEVNIGGKVFFEKLGQAYQITSDGLKAYRRLLGVNKAKKVSKNVFWEMLCPKARDRFYIRTRRAYIIKFLADSNKELTLDKLQEKLLEVGFSESLGSIQDDISGLQNIGLFIKESNRGFFLMDKIQKLIIPLSVVGSKKSNNSNIKDICRQILVNVPHRYLNLIDLAYDSRSNRLFEMEVMDLLVSCCGYGGLHLGGSRKPDGIIYTRNLNANYGVIIDTKAYSKGYSLPISQADEMRRYIDENNSRNININSNEWWNMFPSDLDSFSFLFVSSEFVGHFEDRILNIFQTSGVKGAAINVFNLLLLSEYLMSGFIDLNKAHSYFESNQEVRLEEIRINFTEPVDR